MSGLPCRAAVTGARAAVAAAVDHAAAASDHVPAAPRVLALRMEDAAAGPPGGRDG
eukprot:gene51871-64120_t